MSLPKSAKTIEGFSWLFYFFLTIAIGPLSGGNNGSGVDVFAGLVLGSAWEPTQGKEHDCNI